MALAAIISLARSNVNRDEAREPGSMEAEEKRAEAASIQPRHRSIAWAERLSIAIEARLDQMDVSSRRDS